MIKTEFVFQTIKGQYRLKTTSFFKKEWYYSVFLHWSLEVYLEHLKNHSMNLEVQYLALTDLTQVFFVIIILHPEFAS